MRKKSYRVIYHNGPELQLKTKVLSGRATVNREGLSIDGETEIEIPTTEVTKVELYRLHGSMSIIRVEHAGGTLHVAPVRINLFGYFVVVNFFAARRLCDELNSLVENRDGSAVNR
jgi:hypothetical protein